MWNNKMNKKAFETINMQVYKRTLTWFILPSRSTPLSLVGAQAEPFSLPGDFKTVKLVKLGKGKRKERS